HDRTQNTNSDLEEVIPRVENIKEIRDHPIDQVIEELDEKLLDCMPKIEATSLHLFQLKNPRTLRNPSKMKVGQWTCKRD
ncbi:hypothetical protein Tco_1363779, partial [Tanacetum coccineum]